MPAPTFPSNAHRVVFDALPASVRPLLLTLRQQIYEIAAKDSRLGQIEESVKWGQPSYTTQGRKAGTPIRLGVTKDGQAAMFVHCQSPVIPAIASQLPPEVELDGTRALHLPPDMPGDHPILAHVIRTALTYRL